MIEARRTRPVTRLVIHSFLALFGLLCIVPLVAVVSIALTDEQDIILAGYSLLPRRLSATAFRYVLSNPRQITHAYELSAVVTAGGTAVALLTIALLAFPLSRADYKYRRPLSFYVFFTMLFNGGLVPWYILISR